jgi:hypothetical protein
MMAKRKTKAEKEAEAAAKEAEEKAKAEAAAKEAEEKAKAEAAAKEAEEKAKAKEAEEKAKAEAAAKEIDPNAQVWVRLIGAKQGMLGSQSVLNGESYQVAYHVYQRACQASPRIWAVKLPGESQYQVKD